MTVGKVRSVLHDRRPGAAKEASLPGNHGKFVFGQYDNPEMRCVLQYYWGLVTLHNAWAFLVPYVCNPMDTTGNHVLMMPFVQALAYPQRALMECCARAPRGRRRACLENKDVKAR